MFDDNEFGESFQGRTEVQNEQIVLVIEPLVRVEHLVVCVVMLCGTTGEEKISSDNRLLLQTVPGSTEQI